MLSSTYLPLQRTTQRHQVWCKDSLHTDDYLKVALMLRVTEVSFIEYCRHLLLISDYRKLIFAQPNTFSLYTCNKTGSTYHFKLHETQFKLNIFTWSHFACVKGHSQGCVLLSAVSCYPGAEQLSNLPWSATLSEFH